MALSVNTTSSIKGASVTFLIDKVLTVASGTNTYLICCIGIHDSNSANRPVIGANWGGVNLTKLISSDQGTSTSTRSEIWYLKNPAAGTNWLEVDVTASVNFLSFGTIVLNGAAQTAPDASNQSGGNSNSASTTITTSTSGIWTISSLLCEPVPTVPPGANWTNFSNLQGQSFQNEAADYDTSGDKTVTYSLSFGSPWQVCLCSIAPAGGGGGASIANKIYTIQQAVNRSNTF